MRFLRSRRRLILLAAAAVAVTAGVGWFGTWWQGVQRERAAVQYIQSTNPFGSLRWDFEEHPHSLSKLIDTSGPEPPGPRFLRDCFGDDAFADVVELELGLPPSCKFEWPILLQLPALENLAVFNIPPGKSGATFDDRFFDQLPKLSKLRSFSIRAWHAAVDDRCLQSLASCPNLERLRLHVSSQSLTRRGVAHLQQLKQLRRLDLRLGILDEGWFQDIAAIRGLHELRVADNLLRDGDIQLLRDVAQLRVLDLSANNISDDGLKILADCICLEEIYLEDTNISDASLPMLTALPKLHSIHLSGTLVSQAEVENLRNKWPEKHVYWLPPWEK